MATVTIADRKEYPNSYEYRRDFIWLDNAPSPKGEKISGEHIDFFIKSSNNSPPISGEVAVFDTQEYPVQMDIKEAFVRVKEHMCTKKKVKGEYTLRKNMLDMTNYESYTLAALLEYLRSEWSSGNRGKVDLSFKEYYMLKPKKR